MHPLGDIPPPYSTMPDGTHQAQQQSQQPHQQQYHQPQQQYHQPQQLHQFQPYHQHVPQQPQQPVIVQVTQQQGGQSQTQQQQQQQQQSGPAVSGNCLGCLLCITVTFLGAGISQLACDPNNSNEACDPSSGIGLTIAGTIGTAAIVVLIARRWLC